MRRTQQIWQRPTRCTPPSILYTAGLRVKISDRFVSHISGKFCNCSALPYLFKDSLLAWIIHIARVMIEDRMGCHATIAPTIGIKSGSGDEGGERGERRH